MTVQNPALYLQGGTHTAEDFRNLITGTFQSPGVLTSTALQVTEKSGTPNMSVDVSGGSCVVEGDEATYQGFYLCHNRGTTNLTVSASDATNDRYDLVVAKVEDSDYSGATDAWSLSVVTGTPAASPQFPTVPSNALVLAIIDVQANATSVTDSDITDIRYADATDGVTTLRNYGTAAAVGGITVTTSDNRPASPYVAQRIFETDTEEHRYYDGSEWKWLHGGTTYVRETNSTTADINTTTEGTATNVGDVIITAGTWYITGHAGVDISVAQSTTVYLHLENEAASTIVARTFFGVTYDGSTNENNGPNGMVSTVLTVTSTSSISLRCWVSSSAGSLGLNNPTITAIRIA